MTEYISDTGISVKQLTLVLFEIKFSSELVNKHSNDTELGRIIREALLDTTKHLKGKETLNDYWKDEIEGC